VREIKARTNSFFIDSSFFAVSLLTYVGKREREREMGGGKSLEEAKISDNDRNSKLT
jgi:hypothetical protein